MGTEKKSTHIIRSSSKWMMLNVPLRPQMMGSNDDSAKPNGNSAAAVWMNQMSMNHAINPMYMNQQLQLPHQHQMQNPQVALAEQQLAGLVNIGLNPMTMSIQQQQQLHQQQKLQMMQLQQRLQQQYGGGFNDQNNSDIDGSSYQQSQQLQQQHQHQQPPQWNPQQLQQNYQIQQQHQQQMNAAMISEGYNHQQMIQLQTQQRE
jgi:hypothetical protein